MLARQHCEWFAATIGETPMPSRTKTAGSGWLAKWMHGLAEEISKIKVEGYEVKAEATKGPEIFVTLVGAAEDSTAARNARKPIQKLMEASIKKNTEGVQGFEVRIQSFNKGADLVLQCTIIFP